MSIRLRIATFNLENFDERHREAPTLAERMAVMRPPLVRLEADVLCLQEVNGQEEAGQPRRLLALQKLLLGGDIMRNCCDGPPVGPGTARAIAD